MNDLHTKGTVVAAILALSAGTSASVLTFTIDGLSNFGDIPQGYGDRVTALDDADFHYDEQGEGFTPNIDVSYTTSTGQRPSYWSTGYGDLVDVYFDDNDSSDLAEIVLTADYGYEVVLYGFEIAGFSLSFSSDPTINAVRVFGCSPVPIYEELNAVISETTHTSFDFSADPLRAREIRIKYDTANLGVLSNDIALDNVRFGQVTVDPVDIACPSDYATPICVLDFFDVSAFLGLFISNDPNADLNGDGMHNFFDVSRFLSEYTAGCKSD